MKATSGLPLCAEAGMPERYRMVLILRDIEDLDTGHVTRMLNITPTAVKVRLHRGAPGAQSTS